MARRTEDVETHLTVRLIGPHEVVSHMVHNQLQVMLPGAVITIADKTALAAVYRAMTEAAAIAESAFADARRSPKRYRQATQRVFGSVLLTGTQTGFAVTGKAPAVSPSGAGQVIVRFGLATIVCDDRAAWDSEHLGWTTACERAAEAWGGPRLATVRARALELRRRQR